MKSPIQQYLKRYSEPPARLLQGCPVQHRHVLVVPACDEPLPPLMALAQAARLADSLFVLVLNEPEHHDSGRTGSANNSEVCAWLHRRYELAWQSPDSELRLYQSESTSVMLVDLFSQRRRPPVQQGVGLARKTGADLALQLIADGKILEPWIYNTDADATLPAGYFACTAGLAGRGPSPIAACILPFEHLASASGELNRAQSLYDLHLHYYRAALAWAGSPYAYTSMGSTQIVSAEHYAKVRGFPKRSAGEDFYLLNKLAKTGRILSLHAPAVSLQTRRSRRTPFGTGAAVEDILQLSNPEQDYLYYHPEIFAALRHALGSFTRLWEHPADLESRRSSPSVQVLLEMGLEQAVAKARQNSRSGPVFLRHIHHWFDAFRTLKYVHNLRDKAYPSVSRAELQNLLPDELKPLLWPERPESLH